MAAGRASSETNYAFPLILLGARLSKLRRPTDFWLIAREWLNQVWSGLVWFCCLGCGPATSRRPSWCHQLRAKSRLALADRARGLCNPSGIRSLVVVPQADPNQSAGQPASQLARLFGRFGWRHLVWLDLASSSGPAKTVVAALLGRLWQWHSSRKTVICWPLGSHLDPSGYPSGCLSGRTRLVPAGPGWPRLASCGSCGLPGATYNQRA